MEATWWFRDGDQTLGPFTPEQMGDLVAAGHVGDDTPCSSDGEAWRPLRELDPFPTTPRPPVERSFSRQRARAKAVRPPPSIWVANVFLVGTAALGFAIALYLLPKARAIAAVTDVSERGLVIECLLLMLIALAQAGHAVFIHKGYEWARLAAIGVILLAAASTLLPGQPAQSMWAWLLHALVIAALLRQSARRYTHAAAVARSERSMIRRRARARS